MKVPDGLHDDVQQAVLADLLAEDLTGARPPRGARAALTFTTGASI